MRRTKKIKDENLLRVNRQSLVFNNKELNAINLYCEKYKIDSKAKFMREAIISAILQKFEDDHPVLFQIDRPNLFSK